MAVKRTMKVLAILILAIFLLGCVQQTAAPLENKQEQKQEVKPAPVQEASSFQKGVSLSPKSFNNDDFVEFFERAKQTGNRVTWVGDWAALYSPEGAPVVVSQLSKQYNYVPVIIVQFFEQKTGKLIEPLDDSNKNAYEKSALAFIKENKPLHFGIGVEINILKEKNETTYLEFVKFYNELYGKIKKEYPNTKVFTVFQLEKMKGLNGGLFGGENNESKAQWSLLNDFNSDLIAFTTYPGLVFKDPSEIPSGYYSEIKTRTSKSVAFTEVGWHSAASPTDFESSEEEQTRFIEILKEQMKEVRPEFVIWSFLYDQDTFEPFNSMGLMDKNGKEKQGWTSWKVNAVR